MKKWLTAMMAAFLVFAFTACAQTSLQETEPQNSTQGHAGTEMTDGYETEPQQEEDKNYAVVYFSATGTTEEIAKKIAEELGADIFEIEPQEPYSAEDLNYGDDSCRANQEMNDEGARPVIRNDLSQVEEYKTIYLGYPIWWGTAPRIIQTFLDSYHLDGKEIYTFCTSGGSGIEQSLSDLISNYPSLNILGGKRFASGDGADTIISWLKELE